MVEQIKESTAADSLWRRAQVGGLPSNVTPFITRHRLLKWAVAEFQAHPTNPEAAYDLNHAYLRYFGYEVLGLSKHDLDLPDGPLSAEQLTEIWQRKEEGKKSPGIPVFIPQAVTSPHGLALLQIGFANASKRRVVTDFADRARILDTHKPSGWMELDAAGVPPYLIMPGRKQPGLTVEELKQAIAARGRREQTLYTYLWGALLIHEVFGSYPDQIKDFWSRISGSSVGGRLLCVSFYRREIVEISSRIAAESKQPNLGGRSLKEFREEWRAGDAA